MISTVPRFSQSASRNSTWPSSPALAWTRRASSVSSIPESFRVRGVLWSWWSRVMTPLGVEERSGTMEMGWGHHRPLVWQTGQSRRRRQGFLDPVDAVALSQAEDALGSTEPVQGVGLQQLGLDLDRQEHRERGRAAQAGVLALAGHVGAPLERGALGLSRLVQRAPARTSLASTRGPWWIP